jgi:3-dehydroquinate synthase class II
MTGPRPGLPDELEPGDEVILVDRDGREVARMVVVGRDQDGHPIVEPAEDHP